MLGALLVWWSVVEPKRRRRPASCGRSRHILGARLAGMFLGMAFMIMSLAGLRGLLRRRAREHGLSPLTDQQIAGGMMLGLDLS